ncbi:hypothetical protein BCR42DRAFT_416119 [Absidia repens]|uniref:Uncharacterized protein n=1 Tax=Absidia repens TaxID=90262 RepID=A0A1X2IGG4_9FUNG|nr:hypothetical protein BCR42DRAFT_416119 [Absidia repens]
MSTYKLSFLLLISMMLMSIHAQYGPKIINPANNATVNPGDKVPILFSYQNMGTGPCSVNISLWQDPSATVKIQDVVTDYTLAPGNSSGAQVAFTKNGTYDWYVPHGMNFSFYLTVTEETETQLGNFSLRSFPIMLHPSAAWAVLPNLAAVLLTIIAVFVIQT